MDKKEIIKLSPEAKRLNIAYKEFEGAIRAFATVLGVSHGSAGRMLLGQQAVSFEVVYNLCRRLGYNPEWVIKGTGPKKQKLEERGKIITDIAEFNTVLQILNKRIDLLEARLKHTESELETYKSQVQKAV